MVVFEPNYTRIVSSVRKNLGITQSVVEVKLQSDEEGVRNVYSIGAKSTVIKSDVSGNELVFNGLVDFQAMVECDSLKFSALDYSAEFKDKFIYDKELSGEVILTSNVIDISSQVVTNGVRVTAIVETNIDIIESVDKNVLTGINGDAEISTDELNYYTYVGKATEKFDVSDEININGVDQIYMVTPSVSISSVVPKNHFAIISGKLNVDICCGGRDGENNIITNNHEVDFCWEVALDDIEENSYIQNAVSILSNEIKVSTSIEDGNAQINILVPINYSGYVFKSSVISVIGDIFSKTHYISTTSEKVDLLKGERSVGFKDNINGVAVISDTAPFIDDVLGVSTNNIVIASCNIDDNNLVVEGIANSTVLYFTKETNLITSVLVEMPFVVEQKVDADICNVVSICLNGLSAKSRRGKEIEVSAEIEMFADNYLVSNNCIISEVHVGEEKPIDECSLYIYVVKPNDTLWDIAKEMNVSEDLIIEQNPDIQLPLVSGSKLVIYNPKVMMF